MVIVKKTAFKILITYLFFVTAISKAQNVKINTFVIDSNQDIYYLPLRLTVPLELDSEQLIDQAYDYDDEVIHAQGTPIEDWPVLINFNNLMKESIASVEDNRYKSIPPFPQYDGEKGVDYFDIEQELKQRMVKMFWSKHILKQEFAQLEPFIVWISGLDNPQVHEKYNNFLWDIKQKFAYLNANVSHSSQPVNLIEEYSDRLKNLHFIRNSDCCLILDQGNIDAISRFRKLYQNFPNVETPESVKAYQQREAFRWGLDLLDYR